MKCCKELSVNRITERAAQQHSHAQGPYLNSQELISPVLIITLFKYIKIPRALS